MVILKQETGRLSVPGAKTSIEASPADPALIVEVVDKLTREGVYVKSGILIALKTSQADIVDIEVEPQRASAPDLAVKLRKAAAKEIENEDGEKIGIIEGDANVKNVTDLGGDKIMANAFVQTLKHKKGKVVLLSDHFYTMADVAGVAHLKDTEYSLRLKAEINLNTQKNKELFSNIKFLLTREVAPGLSIGYDPVKFTPNNSGGYDLHEVAVHEVSVTPFPMNQQSLIDHAKKLKENRKRRQALLQKIRTGNTPQAVV